MKSAVVKRSIVIGGHKTSVSLEDEFWNALKDIVRGLKTTLADMVEDIDIRRSQANLSSAIRLFVLHHFRSQVLPTVASRNYSDGDIPRILAGGTPLR